MNIFFYYKKKNRRNINKYKNYFNLKKLKILMKKTFTSNIPFNKTNFFKLEQERNMLKITLQYINAENTKLKNELEDMRITARKNKEMLKEYITQITNKDKMFEKMNNQIEQLTSRLKLLENFNKLNNKKNSKTDNYVNTTSFANNELKSTNMSTNQQLNSSMNNNKDNNNVNKSFSYNINISNNKATLGTLNLNKNIKYSPIKPFKDSASLNIIKTENSNGSSNFSFLKNNCIINRAFNNKQTSLNSINNAYGPNSEIIKEFLNKQTTLLEEMAIIKDDIQFIKENKSKSKMTEKLNQSIFSNFSVNSRESQKNNNFNNSFVSNNSSLNSSIISNVLNSSINSNLTSSKKEEKLKINLQEKYLINENFTNYLNNYNQYKNIILFVDNNENIWELIKRNDLNLNYINNNPQNIQSILISDKINDKLSNIEIKENSSNSNRNSIEENKNLKYSDFRISKYIEEK